MEPRTKLSSQPVPEASGAAVATRAIREVDGQQPVPGIPSPDGLLPVPAVVGDLLRQRASRQALSEGDRRWLTTWLTLQYYFGGQEIAYRETENSVIVLAVDPEAVAAYLQECPPEERSGVIVGQPDPWQMESSTPKALPLEPVFADGGTAAAGHPPFGGAP